MRQIIFSIAIFACSVAAGQKKESPLTVSYEAAAWKTVLAENTDQLASAAPPSAAQSQSELRTIKASTAKLGKQELADITYWNAGAPAYRWNQIGPRVGGNHMEAWMRTPTAWMNIAIYDATILAWKDKLKYKRKRPNQLDPSIKPMVDVPETYSYPCEHTVTASAAAHVIAYFFPTKGDSVLKLARTAGQSRINAGVQFPSDVEAGWKLGEMVAKQVIEKAKNDGSAAKWDGSSNKDPKKWTGNFPLGITLAKFTPIVLRSPDQFRPGPPPDFEKEMQELRNMKPGFKGSSLAYYWANNGGFEFWSEIAGLKMFEYRMMHDAPAVARIYTILHTAFHEVTIAIMDAKYAYWGIRPSQYDTTFKPLLATPPFPGYPSGHAAGAGTTTAVLEYFFPADAKQFQQLAKDCADSRFYAGIHFRTDNEVGLTLGKNVANYVVESWMKK